MSSIRFFMVTLCTVVFLSEFGLRNLAQSKRIFGKTLFETEGKQEHDCFGLKLRKKSTSSLPGITTDLIHYKEETLINKLKFKLQPNKRSQIYQSGLHTELKRVKPELNFGVRKVESNSKTGAAINFIRGKFSSNSQRKPYRGNQQLNQPTILTEFPALEPLIFYSSEREKHEKDAFVDSDADAFHSAVKNFFVRKKRPFTKNNPLNCKCGKRSTQRIVNGENSSIEEHPWAVQIIYSGDATSEAFCAGTLIRRNIVLTAAHCVESTSPSEIVVKVGANTREDKGITLAVETIKWHSEYSTETYYKDDIALIKLKERVTCTDKVKPICLSKVKNLDDKEGVAVGWGKTEKGILSNNLRKAHVDLMSASKCAKESNYGAAVLPKSVVCASRSNYDACQGDSGGPLVLEHSNSVSQVGVVSWGEGCGAKHYPGVYTLVPHYLNWIITNLKMLTKPKGRITRSRQKNRKSEASTYALLYNI